MHQACLLDWMEVRQRTGGSSAAGAVGSGPIACPQCQYEYRLNEPYGLPRWLLRAMQSSSTALDRGLMYTALAGIAVTGYGALWGYGAGAYSATVGPQTARAFFRAHLGSGRADSVVKVFLGVPLVTVSVLSVAFPSFSWAFPLLPPILYANDVIEWTQWPPSPKLLSLLLPFSLFAYRWAEQHLPSMALEYMYGRPPQPAPDTPSVSMGISQDLPQQESDDSIGLEDERAIKISVLSTTAALALPFAAASVGWMLPSGRYSRILPFHRALLGGALLVGLRDIIRGLAWYQRVLIRPYRKVLSYSRLDDTASAKN